MNRRDAIVAGVVGLTAATTTFGADAEESIPAANPELDAIRAVLQSHDAALTAHDMDGVLACMARKSALMGTGPGEIWAGPEEMKAAYAKIFETFDKGEQAFEYQFRIGDIGTDMAWMLTAGNVTGKKDGKDFAYPLNISITVAKEDGDWKIASMHYSTLASAAE